METSGPEGRPLRERRGCHRDGDRAPDRIGFTRSVGVPRDQLHLQVPTFEHSGGTGQPEKRLREQDEDGVDAEILFSRIQGTLRRIKNDECYEALVHAYNEYLIEEYAGVAHDRLITMGVIPRTGIEAALRELEYCAKAGFKGVLIDKFPSGRGYPTADDRFWAASLEMGMPIPVQMAFAGVWDRFPTLKIYWAETMIGWLPYALWQIDDHYERYKYLQRYHWGLDWLERPPSDYIKQHCLWGFLSDPVGIQLRQAAGTENLLWGSDFAHAASDWPHSRQLIERDFAGVPEAEKYQMTAGNAIRYFHLDGE